MNRPAFWSRNTLDWLPVFNNRRGAGRLRLPAFPCSRPWRPAGPASGAGNRCRRWRGAGRLRLPANPFFLPVAACRPGEWCRQPVPSVEGRGEASPPRIPLLLARGGLLARRAVQATGAVGGGARGGFASPHSPSSCPWRPAGPASGAGNRCRRWRGAGRLRLPAFPFFLPVAARRPGEMRNEWRRMERVHGGRRSRLGA